MRRSYRGNALVKVTMAAFEESVGMSFDAEYAALYYLLQAHCNKLKWMWGKRSGKKRS